jgi:AraC-like DNA-binding protein
VRPLRAAIVPFYGARMLDGLVFGWRTAILTVVIAQLLAIAAALPRVLANRRANRTLAVLLLVLAGVLTPWLIGFAGFYDRWRWLTFAPLAHPLAVAPLLWCYVHALVSGRCPARAWRHAVVPGTYAVFMTAGFLLPMPAKQAWADRVLDGATDVAWLGTAAGLAGYGLLGLRLLTRYRTLLAAQRSDDQRYAARWLSRAVGATLALLPVFAIYAVWNALAPLGYVALMGLHLAIAAFALYLAVEGWRHAALRFPPIDALEPVPAPAAPARDWRAQGEAWAATVRAQGWAADADLSLPVLARRLGTNTAHLSRALNDGLGIGFSAFVNGLRCEAVAAAIDAGARADLLTMALDAGFSSKASFNRAFQARYGMTPSAYRRTSQIMNNGAEPSK